ncbi:MAG: hypothetical protein RBR21_06465 [Bacteroidales bacterium]|nr:hypothetical protein [Bacteroidales bacterium]
MNADDPPGSEYGYKNNILPPSPTAADFSRIAEIQSETATGVPNISIPIFALQLDELTIPITASYNAGGIKVEQLPGNIGLGWSLSVGGTISRVMHQQPDETQTTGYLDYIENMPPRGAILSDPDNNDIKDMFEALANGDLDLEPDIFHYSYPGGCGKFAFGKDQMPYSIPNEPIKIHQWTTDQTGFDSFQINGSNGYNFVYNYPEITRQVGGGSPDDIYYSAWFLDHIESPFSNKICTFQYDQIQYNSISYPQESVTMKWEGSPAHFNAFSIVDHTTIVNHDTYSLKKIVSDTHTLDFYYTLNDQKYVLIDSIKINTVFNGQEEYLKTVIFTYEVVADRHMLMSICFQRNGRNLNPPFQFQYNSNLLPVSSNTTAFRGQDYWGYYNGVTTNTTLIPSLKDASDIPTNQQWANREPVEQYMKAQSLECITYPNGGYTFFDFEAHDRAVINTQYCNDKETVISLYAEGCCETFNAGYINSLPETSISTYEMYYPHWLPNQVAELSLNMTKIDEIDNIVAGFKKVFPKITIEDKTTGDVKVIYPKQSQTTFTISYEFQSGHEYFFEAKAYYSNLIHAALRVEIAENPLEYNASQNEIVGGLRIKSIKNYDGLKTTTKNFFYNKPNSTISSGILLNDPRFEYYTKELECSAPDCSEGETYDLSKIAFVENTVIKKSSPVYPLGSQNGSHVIYKTISIIEEVPAGDRHKTVNTFSTEKDEGGGFPFVPVNDFSWARGKLTNQKIFLYDDQEDAYTLRKEMIFCYTYNNRFSDFDKINIEGLKFSKRSMQIAHVPELYSVSDAFDWKFYNYPTTSKILSQTIEHRYDDNDLIFTNSTEYIYSNSKYPLLTEKIIKTSEGMCTMEEYRYPFDLVEDTYYQIVEDYLNTRYIDCNNVYVSCLGPNDCDNIYLPCASTYSTCVEGRAVQQTIEYPNVQALRMSSLFGMISYGSIRKALNLNDCEADYHNCLETTGYYSCASQNNCKYLGSACRDMDLSIVRPIEYEWATRLAFDGSVPANGIAVKYFNRLGYFNECLEAEEKCYSQFNCHSDYLICKREYETEYNNAITNYQSSLNTVLVNSSTDQHVAGLIHMYLNNMIDVPIETVVTKIELDGQSRVIHSKLKNYVLSNGRLSLDNERHYFPEKQGGLFHYASINANDQLEACEDEEMVKMRKW